MLDADEGLEAALLKHPPSDALDVWIVRETCALLIPKEREVMSAVIRGDRSLRLTKFLAKASARSKIDPLAFSKTDPH